MYRAVFPSIALSFFLLVFSAVPAPAQRANFVAEGRNEGQILSLINRERERSGLSALSWDQSLADLARNYSETMAREGFFDHIDSQGNSVVERAKHAHIRGWQKIGENLFECDPTDDLSNLAVRGWMHSPTHRDNILDPDWRGTGIGIAYSTKGEIYITQIFADN